MSDELIDYLLLWTPIAALFLLCVIIFIMAWRSDRTSGPRVFPRENAQPIVMENGSLARPTVVVQEDPESYRALYEMIDF
ncbi:hypothetical protein QR680_000523 [Steinernema hermaphroditum]|uniref:Uncharacterized protein n=1 Tax=Steinernema hermaphroditum TaxID=289476 RepID=A0AA39GVM1_9BILA|nr:hypothetical protein QR680_000523 [Steinernema hermaphroditum]